MQTERVRSAVRPEGQLLGRLAAMKTMSVVELKAEWQSLIGFQAFASSLHEGETCAKSIAARGYKAEQPRPIIVRYIFIAIGAAHLGQYILRLKAIAYSQGA